MNQGLCFMQKITPFLWLDDMDKQGQIRCNLAGRSHYPGRDAFRQGPGKIETGHESDAQDGKNRRPDIKGGVRTKIA